ncbi:MAG: PQQ-binding-like beta-propeller repeat protein [Candidatus Bathyarchaeota archaeon]|nr:PQQ-binding-like beta-propeller repeat protein [Candidatus Termiticorpusculum sp.]
MNYIKNKNVLSMLSILLMLSFVVSMLALPNANAQTTTPKSITSYAFVDALPNPAGVGQPVLINWGLIDYLQHVRDGWNITLQITHPNGKVENITGMTWSTGTVGRKMSFTEPGNYTLQCIFDGTYYAYGGSTTHARSGNYQPCTSDNITLQILEGFWKGDHPGHTLPTEYWTRPVDSQLREWYTMMGSWYVQKPRNTNLFAPYNDAPTTAHILWSTPDDQYLGGIGSGEYYGLSYQHGDAYEAKFNGAVIVGGILFYNVAPIYSGNTNALNQTVRALDLHTGKELWRKDVANAPFGPTARLARAQTVSIITPNNRGLWSYLWVTAGTNWYALDPLSGRHIYTMTGVPTGEVYYGPSGEMLIYTVVNAGTQTNPNWMVRQWNSTRVVMHNRDGAAGGSDAWGSGVNTNGSPNSFAAANGYNWNISLTRNLGAPVHAFPDDRIIFANVSTAGVTLSAVQIDEDNFGQWLYRERHWAPSNNQWEGYLSIITADTQSGWAAFSNDPYVGVFWTKEDRVNHVFNLNTGRIAWQSEPQNFADSWGGARSNSSPEKVIVYGKLIEGSGGGIVYCYNATTGVLEWTFEQKDKYNESYHRENWWVVPCFVSDGKIYLGYQVHSSQEPKPRGAPFYALDIETGEVVWQIDGAFRQLAWGGRAIIGDSVIATIDSYDSQVYAIGKGPSEMTVAASNAVATAGNTVLISGTVMDISPGTQQDNLQMRFSKGVPAVSDESMSDWMLYVYKQFARPMDTTGVEVTVFAQQGDRVIDVGTAVSDDSGRFAITWTTPDDATGNWDVYAYFSGSGAYYGSWAKSEMAVLAAPIEPPPEPLPPYGLYIALAAIAIIIAVAIVGLLLFKKINTRA